MLTDSDIDVITDKQWDGIRGREIAAAHRAYARAIEAAVLAGVEQRQKSFGELHPRNPNRTCKCEHWQSCVDCHPTAHQG